MSLKSTFKGFLGETVINVAMWLKLEKDIYHRLNGITLPLANGGSTQIDHVIVSVYGIFVIETKNYKGWIYGSENQKQWTQSFPNGSKFKFQNPLRQNYLHIKTLADLLGLELSYFHSMVAFIGECELKTRDELPEHVLTSGMVSYVKRKQDKLLTEDEVTSIVEQIESNRFSKSWRTNRQHKAYLKDKHSNPSKNTDNPTPEPTVKETVKRPILKSREVQRWSGQTEIESNDLTIDVLNIQQTISPYDMTNKVFLTPFEIVESEPQVKEPEILKAVEDAANLVQTPTCPRCNGEMIKRVAKTGARQGQSFYGCAQFPKCRGVVNMSAP
ncbi:MULTISPECIES: nuclease-related domain-containing protein [Psychrobacter]|uniref:DNA topoisomerase I n=2 Tax=Psychrobacter alimentarius TaxID=261164 RepID=A0ABM6A008_9GAMM|nr:MULTISPECIES: NERD domain-containing protein [Psychrobacter]AMT97650.1 DNA topoisomerase I [Psychrobacter alimentarius]QCB30059.1 DNA topoisomerase I [Psychrobacter sp. PAMC27889]